MPDQTLAQVFMEKGFWYAIGFICTASLTIVGLKARNEASYRMAITGRFKDMNERVDIVHKKISSQAQHVAENYPDKEDFKTMMLRMEAGFSDLKDDIREVRNK